MPIVTSTNSKKYLLALATFIFLTPSTAEAIIISPPPSSPGSLTFTGLPTTGIGAYGLALSGDGLTSGGYIGSFDDTTTQPVYWRNGQMVALAPDSGYVTAISKNGSTIVGTLGDVYATAVPLVWKNGQLITIDVGNATYSNATFVSDDGETVAGYFVDGSIGAYVWKNGVTTNLNISGLAMGMSADGSTLFGFQNDPITYDQTGFIWRNGVNRTIPGLGNSTIAFGFATSANGNITVGAAADPANGLFSGATAFLYNYTTNTTTDIGGLGGTFSSAGAITPDGSVVAGVANNSVDNNGHIWRWTNNQLTDLGSVGESQSGGISLLVQNTLPPNFSGLDISDNGNVIAYTGGYGTTPYRWTSTTGLHTLSDILTDAGVNLTGWDLADTTPATSELSFLGGAISVSDDGKYILANGTVNGEATPYIVYDSGSTVGVITPEELVESIKSTSTGSQQTQSAMNVGFSQSILAARQAVGAIVTSPILSMNQPTDLNNIQPAAGGVDPLFNRSRWSSYVIGNLGVGQSNDFGSNAMSGATGIITRPSDEVAVGVGIIGSRSNTDLRLGGSSQLTASGTSVLAAYEPSASGLRLYGTAMAAYLDVDMNRRYLNGATVDRSDSKTHGFGYGAAVQAGWAFKQDDKTSVMPYVGVDASHSRLDGYQEVGGAFAATVGDQTGKLVTTHLGAEVSHQLTDPLTVRGRAAWGHRVTGSGGAVTASIGAITQAVPYQQGDRDWAEFGATGIYKLSANTSLMGDLSTRIGETSEPAVNATVGFTFGF